jgi:hypothetical protein
MKVLVEQCQKININDLVRESKKEVFKFKLEEKVELLGRQVQFTTSFCGLGGTRYWFKCPLCTKRVGTLFIHPLNQQVGCRACLGLEYRGRRYKGMIEAL